MLGWRVRRLLTFVAVHIPEEYFSFPKHRMGQKVSESVIHRVYLSAAGAEQSVVAFGEAGEYLKHFLQTLFCHTDIVLPHQIAGTTV